MNVAQDENGEGSSSGAGSSSTDENISPHQRFVGTPPRERA